MKITISTYVLPLVLLCASAGQHVMAQDSTAIRRAEAARIDSLAEVQQRQDSDNLSDLKAEKADAQAKAKEAQRVERDANEAAQQSRTAYRSEQQAQKARKKADKQAKKAAHARRVSDANEDN